MRSANALEYAVALGTACAAEIDVLHVWHSDLATPVMVARDRAKSALREFVAKLGLRGDVVLRRRTDHGDPYLTISRLAQPSGYDLLVVAGPEASRANSESVARGLLASAAGAVLFVPAHCKARLRSDADRALTVERSLVPLALAGGELQALLQAEALGQREGAMVEVLLGPDVPPETLARFRDRPKLPHTEELMVTEESALATPKRVQASRFDLVIMAGKRAGLGERTGDARLERVALSVPCPSLCLPG